MKTQLVVQALACPKNVVRRTRQAKACTTYALTLVTLLTLLSAPRAHAQTFINSGNFSGGPNPIAFFGQGVTNIGLVAGITVSNICWFVAPANAYAVPRIEQIQATGDLIPAAAGSLQFYYSTNSGPLTNAGASGTNQLWMDTTGFASNDVVVVQSINSGFYQRCMVTNCSTSNLFIHPLAAFAVAVGDKVFKETPGATLPLSGATNYCFNPGGALGVGPLNVYGRIGQPLLMDFSYSNSASIKSISGSYLPYRDR